MNNLSKDLKNFDITITSSEFNDETQIVSVWNFNTLIGKIFVTPNNQLYRWHISGEWKDRVKVDKIAEMIDSENTPNPVFRSGRFINEVCNDAYDVDIDVAWEMDRDSTYFSIWGVQEILQFDTYDHRLHTQGYYDLSIKQIELITKFIDFLLAQTD